MPVNNENLLQFFPETLLLSRDRFPTTEQSDFTSHLKEQKSIALWMLQKPTKVYFRMQSVFYALSPTKNIRSS